MRQHRNNVELRVVNPCTARCKTHLICDCEVVRMTISSTSEKKATTTFQKDAKISLIMKQNTLEKLCPSKECLSKDAIIRLYEPFHYFESENGALSNALLCTDLVNIHRNNKRRVSIYFQTILTCVNVWDANNSKRNYITASSKCSIHVQYSSIALKDLPRLD